MRGLGSESKMAHRGNRERKGWNVLFWAEVLIRCFLRVLRQIVLLLRYSSLLSRMISLSDEVVEE